MNTTLKYGLYGAALAVAAALPVAAWAMGPPEGMDRDPARMMAHISKQLDLTDVQQAKVEKLLAAAKQAGEADHQRMEELRGELKAMQGSFDSAKARKIADEIGQLTGRLVYQMSETWSQVYEQLDTQQQAELDSMMAKREERRGKWRDSGGN